MSGALRTAVTSHKVAAAPEVHEVSMLPVTSTAPHRRDFTPIG
jgi:hypothetical protein